MKKLLFSVLLLPVLASAQEPVIVDKKVVCNLPSIIFETVTKQFNETPVWLGTGELDSKYALFRNKNGSWSLVQFNENIACVIGAGESNKEIFGRPST